MRMDLRKFHEMVYAKFSLATLVTGIRYDANTEWNVASFLRGKMMVSPSLIKVSSLTLSSCAAFVSSVLITLSHIAVSGIASSSGICGRAC